MKYLFTHFTGEHKDGEQVYFSLSSDGLNWEDLNFGNLVLSSSICEKGIRDPFIVKDEIKNKYYIIATDLRIANDKGWGIAQFEGSRNIIVWESEDLINWSKERSVEVGVEGAGCVWAPEAIYVKEKEAFFVFFASMTKRAGEEYKQKIYSTWTKDFVNFTTPEIYIERENHVIDTTIAYDDGVYYRFSKDETTKKILMEKGTSLDKDAFEEVNSGDLETLYGVEGPEIYKLEGNKWCLIVDRFAEGKGYLPLVTENIVNGGFKVVEDSAFDFGKTLKRHGGVIQITDDEYDRLKWFHSIQNPVLSGLYADPAICIFDNKFYIYPTTDGFDGWSGYQFSVFSSEDGVNFKNEGQILDVKSDQVEWAIGSAWAPCATKRDDNYYFYFCAKEASGSSCIGVAKSKSPIGPFVAEKTPLLTMDLMRECGIKMGQTIDPAMYCENGEYYILFGNGDAAIAKLNDDMVSIDKSTLKNIDGLHDFREAVEVLKREGVYHFTWSCDDTGSENYHVNYGVADSLYGPVTLVGTILEKDPSKDILGTGHHSFVKHPDKDEYYIAYHRFGTPLDKYTVGKGFNRETCLSLLAFKENRIMKVIVK